MATPESKVKDAIKKRLADYGVYPHTHADKHPDLQGAYFMPVAGPYSVIGIHDFVGCWCGVFFSIETKAPNNPDDETAHQGDFRVAFTRAGGVSLTGVRSADAVDELWAVLFTMYAEGRAGQPSKPSELDQQFPGRRK